MHKAVDAQAGNDRQPRAGWGGTDTGYASCSEDQEGELAPSRPSNISAEKCPMPGW